MFNANNPAGTVTESVLWISILGCALLLGSAVSLKRLYLGLQLGKRAYNSYGEKLAGIISKMLLVSEVATLSSRKRGGVYETYESRSGAVNINMSFHTNDESSAEDHSRLGSVSAGRQSIHGSTYYKSSRNSNQQLIMQQLEQWEEPVRAAKKKKVSCQDG